MTDTPIIAVEKQVHVGYRVLTYDAAIGLWSYSDQTTEERARKIYEARNALGKPTKLQRVTQIVEVIGQPTFKTE